MKFSEFPYYKPDINVVTKNYEELFEKFTAAESFEEQDKIFLKLYEAEKEFLTMETIAYVRFTSDTTNESFVEDQEYFDFINPVFGELEKKYYELFNSSPFLKQYEQKYGKQLIKNCMREAIISSDELEDEYRKESSLVNDYIKLRSGATINFEDKEVTLNGMRAYYSNLDRNIRKKSLEASYNFYVSKNEQTAKVFDELVKIRTEMAKKLGHDNYTGLAYILLKKEFSLEDIKKFRENIVKYFIPVVLRLKERQRKRINVDKMMYYDSVLNFKTGNPKPKGDTSWVLEKGIEMYRSLSPETNEFITYMAENELIDLSGRKGKKTGGYSTFFFNHRAPYIFVNMNGTSSDIEILTHEAGHAFQNYLCKDYKLDVDIHASLDICEIHSMSMEFLAYDYMNIFFAEDTNKFYFKHIEDSILAILFASQSDEFQEIIYTNPQLTKDERNQVWKELTLKYTIPSDYDGNEFLLKGISWHNRAQIFFAPFYAIEYALAQIVAYQFLFKKKENHEEAFKEYVEFCRLGGKHSFSEALKTAGLKNPIEVETVKEMAEKIEAFLDTIDDSNF